MRTCSEPDMTKLFDIDDELKEPVAIQNEKPRLNSQKLDKNCNSNLGSTLGKSRLVKSLEDLNKDANNAEYAEEVCSYQIILLAKDFHKSMLNS